MYPLACELIGAVLGPVINEKITAVQEAADPGDGEGVFFRCSPVGSVTVLVIVDSCVAGELCTTRTCPGVQHDSLVGGGDALAAWG